MLPGLAEILQLRPVEYVYRGNGRASANVNTRLGQKPEDRETVTAATLSRLAA